MDDEYLATLFPPLYKRTSNDAIQVWRVEVDVSKGRYRMHSGQLGGAQVTSKWTTATAKNVGRANAVSAADQAVKEAEAEWKKKQRREGYVKTVEEAEGSERFRCMLAQSFDDEKRRRDAFKALEEGRLYSQPKLDGMRLIASVHGLESRTGLPVEAVPHIHEALRVLFMHWPSVRVDGELYHHDFSADFDELMSRARKRTLTGEDKRRAGILQFHVYDAYDSLDPEQPFGPRFWAIEKALGKLGVSQDVVKIVHAEQVRDVVDLDLLYQRYLHHGYEGQMLRIDGPYQPGKRSPLLLKRKEFQDEEFRVVAIEEGVGNASGLAGYVVVEDKAGTMRCRASITGTTDKRRALLQEAARYLNGEVTVRFNGRTPSGVPRNPRAVSWWPGGRQI